MDNQVVAISDDSDLARMIENRGSASVASVISNYIMDVFGGEVLNMSDGIEVVNDRHDAKKLSQYPKPRKTAENANIKRIIENSVYDHSINKVSHKKFDTFYYYVGNVSYVGVVYGVELCVGEARNDKTSYLYDIRDWNKNGTADSSKTNSPMPGQKTGVSDTSDSFINNMPSKMDSVKSQIAEGQVRK